MKRSGLADRPFFSPPKSTELKTAPPPREQPDQEKKADNEKEGSAYRSDEGPEVEPGNRSADQILDPQVDKTADQSTNRFADQPTSLSTNRLTDRPTDRPKS